MKIHKQKPLDGWTIYSFTSEKANKSNRYLPWRLFLCKNLSMQRTIYSAITLLIASCIIPRINSCTSVTHDTSFVKNISTAPECKDVYINWTLLSKRDQPPNPSHYVQSEWGVLPVPLYFIKTAIFCQYKALFRSSML